MITKRLTIRLTPTLTEYLAAIKRSMLEERDTRVILRLIMEEYKRVEPQQEEKQS